jgi:hypothetical protein
MLRKPYTIAQFESVPWTRVGMTDEGVTRSVTSRCTIEPRLTVTLVAARTRGASPSRRFYVQGADGEFETLSDALHALDVLDGVAEAEAP